MLTENGMEVIRRMPYSPTKLLDMDRTRACSVTYRVRALDAAR